MLSPVPLAAFKQALRLVRAAPPVLFVAEPMASSAQPQFDARSPSYLNVLPSLTERLAAWGLPPFDTAVVPSGCISRQSLLDFIKIKAKNQPTTLQGSIDDLVQLRRFLLLSQCTEVSVAPDSNVRIELSTQQDESSIRRFVYRVRMSLLPSSKYSLLTLTHRTLVFEDSSGTVLQQVIKEPKVVGQTPKLRMGERLFQYFSFFDDSPPRPKVDGLKDGAIDMMLGPMTYFGQQRELFMSGSYFYRTPEEEEVVVPIPKTRMLRLVSRG